LFFVHIHWGKYLFAKLNFSPFLFISDLFLPNLIAGSAGERDKDLGEGHRGAEEGDQG